uniref:L10-interacting MYB domain-containing protein n=1 Tax=Cucumis melo TaxID=3656 RepID=A0A9I9D9H2_CUCME
MNNQTNISSDRLGTNWTPAMEQYFIDLMLNQVHRGNRMGHTFNKQAWNDMLMMFNAKFGSPYDINILKSRYTNLWKQFNDIRNLLDNEGFSWDNARQMVIAENNIWDSFIRAHPHIQSYRNRPLINFNNLCLIYAHTAADGRYSMSSHDLDFDDDIMGLCIGVGMNGLAPVNKESSRTGWTLPMDQYLVKLMIDQVRKGCRINGTFKKQAWEDMITLFNAEFGYQHRKSFLKHRYRKLKTYYIDLRNLLEGRGFSWDEKQQMVVADDGVWEDYIKANPDAHVYRKRTLLNFLDLCLIYDDTMSNGHCDHMQQLERFECAPEDSEEEEIQCHADRYSSSMQWSFEMDGYFMDLMLEAVGKVKKFDYNDDLMWTSMISSFKERFGLVFNQDSFRRHFKSLEKKYYDLKNILKQRGFWWDERRHLVIAYDDTWAAYIKEHPHAKSYRTGPIPSYNDLCLIYGNLVPDSRPGPKHLDQEIASDGKDAKTSHSYRWSSDWTPQMDRCLIDLMLYQVRTGNMVDQKFNKQAWDDMVSKFNAEFGPQHDEDVLKSRFFNLRKRFRDMKFLLNQDGFVWDELLQMIIAEDDLWDAYIEEYPDARFYKSRALPNFNDLFLIFGKDNTSNHQHYLFNSVDADDSYPEVNIVNEAEEQFFSDNSDETIIEWTNEMDDHYVNLMLEQVRRGNKTGSMFTDHAWAWMVTSFNKTFKLTCDRNFLESRFFTLKKEYKDAQHMVDQKNMSRARIHQSTATNNEVSETHIKELANDSERGGRSFDRECEVSYQRKRLKSTTPSISVGNKKVKRIKDEMQEIGSNKASLMKNVVNVVDYSIENVVSALQSVPDMDDELFLEACKLLEDERKAKVFIAMDVTTRKKWLSKKFCR